MCSPRGECNLIAFIYVVIELCVLFICMYILKLILYMYVHNDGY